MTAPTRTSVVVFDASVNPGNTTKATAMAAATPAAGNGGWIDITAFNGGDLGWSITNSGSAPSVNPSFTIQFAGANKDVIKGAFDRWTGGGDTFANSVNSGLIPIPSTARYVRGLVYGHQTNSVGVFMEVMLKG